MHGGRRRGGGAPVTRWLVSGVPGYLGWILSNLILLPFLPVLFAISLFDRRGGYRVLNRFGSAYARAFFVRYLSAVGVHRFGERPRVVRTAAVGPRVYVANHRSWMDALFALALFPGVRIPVKESYVNAPILGLIIRWIGCIPLDPTAPRSVHDAVGIARRGLARGSSLFVFPEGTRAPDRRVRSFTDAFFRLAIEAGVPVVPVVIHSDVPSLGPSHESLLTGEPPTWRIEVLEELARDSRDRASDLARAARKIISARLEVLDGPGSRGGRQETGDEPWER
jgi:1-acyl-sn-glycerol-3-phosphate acyltransferase